MEFIVFLSACGPEFEEVYKEHQKLSKMERSTFFVSAYPGLGSTSRWKELLIHDGEVVAATLKSNN